MNFDPLITDLIKNGGYSGVLIAIALVYLGLQVRGLHTAVDAIRKTLEDKVFPRLDDHDKEIAELKGTAEGRYKMWEAMRSGDK